MTSPSRKKMDGGRIGFYAFMILTANMHYCQYYFCIYFCICIYFYYFHNTNHPIRATNTNSNTCTIDQQSLDSNLTKISAAKKAGAHTSKLFAAVVASLLQELRKAQIPFLVAPYEADGQLAFLSKCQYIDCIVSENSDSIPHGARAVLYKYKTTMSYQSSSCVLQQDVIIVNPCVELVSF